MSSKTAIYYYKKPSFKFKSFVQKYSFDEFFGLTVTINSWFSLVIEYRERSFLVPCPLREHFSVKILYYLDCKTVVSYCESNVLEKKRVL